MEVFRRAQSRGDRPGARITFLRPEVSPGIRVCPEEEEGAEREVVPLAPPTPGGAVRREVDGGGMRDEAEEEGGGISEDADADADVVGLAGVRVPFDDVELPALLVLGGESRTERRACNLSLVPLLLLLLLLFLDVEALELLV